MKTYLADLGERVAEAYLVSFVGLVTVAGFDWLDLASWKAAAIAAAPAAYAVVKGAVAKFVGDRRTASLVRARGTAE